MRSIIGTPQVVTQFETGRSADATPDLQKFIQVRVMHSEPGKAIRIVDNWWP